MQQWRTVWAIGWVSVVNAVILSEYHAPSYKFTAVNIDDLLRDDENFIGHVVEVTDSDNIKFWCRAVYSSWHLVCLNLCREKFNSASCPSVVDTYHISYKWNSFTTIYIRGYIILSFQVLWKFLLAPRHVMDKLHKAHRLSSCSRAIPLKPFDKSISVLVMHIIIYWVVHKTSSSAIAERPRCGVG